MSPKTEIDIPEYSAAALAEIDGLHRVVIDLLVKEGKIKIKKPSQ